jgi:6,7-dimethyl-8-ribityllumazine synthase
MEGTTAASGMKLAIVASRFNEIVVGKLLSGAIEAFVEHGGKADDVVVARVPGAWELPQAARQIVARGGIDAVVALGCVIRGDTPHFDYVAGEAARGLGVLADGCDVPIAFGVLTTDNPEQAFDRAGGKAGHKGAEAVVSAIEMVNLFRSIRGTRE